MDALVGHDLAVDLRLGVQVLVVLGLDVLDDWLPAVAVVDGVAEAGRVDDAQAQLHAALAQHHLTRLHLSIRRHTVRRTTMTHHVTVSAKKCLHCMYIHTLLLFLHVYYCTSIYIQQQVHKDQELIRVQKDFKCK